MIRSKTINDIVVKSVVISDKPKDKILGSDLFPKLNANILITAPKNSGKTTVIYRIIDECADKDTHVIIFAATVNNDPMWKEIKKMLQKKKIRYSSYISIFTDTGQNIVSALIETLQDDANIGDDKFDPNEKKVVLKKYPIMLFEEITVEKTEPVKKKKIEAVDYLIIFDDLSDELKNRAIPKLMKIQRHFSSKIIISSQSYVDADIRIRKGNFDYLLLFKGITDDDLFQISKEQAISIPFELFDTLYHAATKEKPHFFYVDKDGIYRKDFNKEYEILEI